MAKEVMVKMTDDLDGSDAAETVYFALDGRQYEIDLSAKNAAQIRKAFEKFVGAGRRTQDQGTPTRRRRTTTPQPRDFDLAAVREWAAQNNIEVSSRGRIPQAVIDQYKAAVG